MIRITRHLTLPLLVLSIVLACFAPYLTAQEQTSSDGTAEQEPRDLVQQREDWFYGQRAYPQEHVPAGVRLRALEQLEGKLATEAAAAKQRGSVFAAGTNPAWSLIGPQPIHTPYSFPMVSGRVSALAVDPRSTSTVYLGAAQGGVWKTTDDGSTWTPLTDTQNSLAIGAIALDPSNPDIVYLGTGEENFSGDSYYGAGILKSTNAGGTWTSLCGPFCGPLGADGYYGGGARIGGIAVHPTNGQILLAAVALLNKDGIYRSTDGGSTWTRVIMGNPGTAVIFDPTDGNIAYAALGSSFLGGVESVYKSADAGQTWTATNGTGTGALPLTNASRIVLAMAPSQTTTLYAGIANLTDGSLLGLFKTVDGGKTWARLASTPDYCTPQCWYDHVIAVQPTNANVVYAGGAFTTTLVRSMDGGTTWAILQSAQSGGFLHADMHALAFFPDGSKLYLGNDGGVYSTAQVTATTPSFGALNSTLAITQFYPGLSIHPTNASIAVGGTQDNGTDIYSGGLTWNQVTCGDGGYTAIDTKTPSTMYAACPWGAQIFLEKSTSNGSFGTWNASQSGIFTTDRADFIAPLVMDPSRTSTLYFGTYRIYQTTDGAGTWNAISPDLTNGSGFWGVVTSIGVAPTDSNTVYAGTGDSHVQVTTNAGSGAAAIWVDRSVGLPPRVITQVAVDPHTASTAYVTFSGFTGFGDNLGHVFKTTNAGVSWADISGNLPNTPVNAIVTVPGATNLLFAGTDVGVFYTTNGGTSWTSLVNGLPRVAVLGLALHNATHTLRASTHGRSVWDVNINSILPGVSIASIAPSSATVGGAGFTLTVKGVNFDATSVVQWNAANLVTTFASSTQITASVPASDINTSGTFQVTVFNSSSNQASNAATFSVNKAGSSTTLTSSLTPSTFGAAVTFTATVTSTGGTPTGTATFKDGSTTLGTGTLSSGKATFSTSALAVGPHSITATYGGSINYNTSTSAVLTETVNKAASSTTVVSSHNPSVFDQSVTFTATVAAVAPGSGTPTGTITFKNGATVLGTGTLTSGKATFSTSALAVGPHSITAVYGGGIDYNTSTSAVLTETVNKAASSTTVVSSHNPSVFGQSVTFTATVAAVAPGSGTPTGTVTFKNGTTVLGTGTLTSGKAAFSTSVLAVGPHSITAAYGGSANYNTSASADLTETVNKAASSTTVVSSHNPSVFDQSVTFTATVAAVAPGSGTPTGTITFKNGATVLATGTLTSGKATFSTSALAVGPHSITATYGGSVDYNTSASAVLTETVNKAASSTTVISSHNPSVFDQSVTFTATVAAVAPGSGTPTGTITFKNGATVLATGTLTSGKATFSTSALAVGPHSITAVYGGSIDYNTSTSAVLTETVNKAASSTTVVSSHNPSVFGQSVTFTATVAAVAPGSGTPTGTVTFKNGTTVLGTGTLTSGKAAFSTSVLAVGPHSITAAYGGSANYNTSTSAVLTETVNKAASSTKLTSSLNPSTLGKSVTFTNTVVTVAPGSGTPTGTVTLKNGATTVGTATLASGKATISTSALTHGAHSMTAVYSGSVDDLGSTSTILTQTVN